MSDSAGGSVAINSYDEYGIPAATNTGRFGYTGQAWLPELGMYHYKARMYSPSLGRFMQTDPIGYEDQFNLYAYVGNDPVNLWDPSGRSTSVITIYDYGIGTHSATITIRNRETTIYDPAGGWATDNEVGNGDWASSADMSNVSMKDYVKYHLEHGSSVRIQTLETTAAEDAEVADNALEQGGTMGGFCTSAVCGALRGAGRLDEIGKGGFFRPDALADSVASQESIPLARDVTMDPDGTVTDNIQERENAAQRESQHREFCQSHPGANC